MKAEMDEQELKILTWIVPLCSFAGLVALLRSQQAVTMRAIASAVGNSAIFGVAIAWLMLWRFGIDQWQLIVGVSILSGLGGTSLVEFTIEILKAWLNDRTGKS